MPQEQKTQINFRSAYLFKFARLPAFSRSLSSKHTLENKLYESKKILELFYLLLRLMYVYIINQNLLKMSVQLG